MAGRFKITERNPPPPSDCHLGSRLRIKTECQDGFPPSFTFLGVGRKLLLPGGDVTMYKVMVPIRPESAARRRLGGYSADGAAETERGVKLVPLVFE